MPPAASGLPQASRFLVDQESEPSETFQQKVEKSLQVKYRSLEQVMGNPEVM